MKAILIEAPGDESVMRMGETGAPRPGPDDLHIQVRSTSVNRADLLQRQGLYPPPPGASPILGLECAGEVLSAGERVSGWSPGDRVMALLPGGGYAAEAVVHAGSALPVPDSMSDTEAGAFPEVFLTAFLDLFLLGGVAEGSHVLVHGGGSGVGTAATSLCREAGVRILVTAGSDEKCRRCLEHGADRAFDYRAGDFAVRVLDATGGRGVDVVLDCIGGAYLAPNLACLATGGRLVVIGLMGGTRAELDLAILMRKRVSIIGSTLRPRGVEEKAGIVRSFLERFGAPLAEGRLRPVIDRELPLAEAPEAHRIVQSSSHFGKVALRL